MSVYLMCLDLTGEEWENCGCSESVAAICHRSVPSVVVTVVLSKSTPRYRVQADSLAAMCIVVTQLVSRLEAHYASRHMAVTISNSSDSLPFPPLLVTVDRHLALRSTLKTLQVSPTFLVMCL